MPRGVPANGRRMTQKYKAELANALIVKAAESRFTINQRFGFTADMVTMLAKGQQPSVVVTGPGGLGKSHTVVEALVKAGLEDLTFLENFQVGDRLPPKAFRVVKGFATPKGLYRELYQARDGVIVFDDCDSVLKNDDAVNLLKGALDSYDRRIISWKADMQDDNLPNSFEFRGGVVFISNLPAQSLDQAIITRSLAVDLTMTTEQKVERMRYLLTLATFMPSFTAANKRDAMDLIEKVKDKAKELSLRTLIQATKIRASGLPNWKDLAEYAICG